MTGANVVLVLAVFVACCVEAVEATTVVLAVGLTRGWRAPLLGTAAGLGLLAVAVVALGPALTAIPIGALRLVVGGLLLVFGLTWLRKAILRASGLKALHDEDALFAEERQRAAIGSGPPNGLDAYAFTICFKSVLLEGLEVVFIVLTFGSNQNSIPLAAAGAVAAVLLVTAVAVVVRGPLSRVPENSMKFAVGVLLISFGLFWGTEGAGAQWPGSDVSLLAIIPIMALISIGMVMWLRRTSGLPRRRPRTDARATVTA
jgi:uncharacterized membrane protein